MIHYATLIYVVRPLVVVTGAAFAGALIAAVRPVWKSLSKAEKTFISFVVLYTANVTIFTALVLAARDARAPGSLIHVGFLASFVVGHASLLYARRERKS